MMGNTLALITVDDPLLNDPCAIENHRFRHATFNDIDTKEIYHSMGFFKAGHMAECAHVNSVFKLQKGGYYHE